DAQDSGRNFITGKEAFTLYDTYGFPLDLTELILKEKSMTLDLEGFNKEMEAQKQRARNAAAVETGDWVVLRDGEQEFVGYDVNSCTAQILRYRQIKHKNRSYYQIILSRTPFYAEMGGQVGDRGTLTADDEIIEIFDTKKENGIGVHLSEKLPSDPSATFRAAIDEDARFATSCNHTATHLLHEALREVLGSHVEQKGSFVSPDVLRFDFSHYQKLTPEEIRKVEHLANRKIRKAIPRDEHRNIPIAKAREMGAMALFGEKYGDEVRVIRYGDSIELCGGTHVDNTGNIGMIHIISESSIAAGIRRIEAITGEAVENTLDRLVDTAKEISAMLNNAPDITLAIRKAIEENAELRKKAEETFKEKADMLSRELLQKATIKKGIKIVELTGRIVPDMVKNVAFAVRTLSPEVTAFIAATKDLQGKPLLTVMVTDDVAASGHNAASIVREAAKAIKGGGGGQPGFAQAGGKDAEGLSKAAEILRSAF
ncbi:MAG: alanine--tRNA ligase, partial [Muribaculaceae bacterium]|nr:alanine--tRNA ligase [Muribaculaceae bacterium]